jgi:hypothetical protein
MGVISVLEFEPIWGLNWPADFNLDPLSLESAPTLDYDILRREIDHLDTCDMLRPPMNRRVHLDHSLMLFLKLSRDNAFDGIDPISLMAACMDTVLLWSRG